MAKKKRKYTPEAVLEAYRIAADILEAVVNNGLWYMDPGCWTEKKVNKLYKYVNRVEENNQTILDVFEGEED